MKIKRLKKIRINSSVFKMRWKKESYCGYFNYDKKIIEIGLKDEDRVLMILSHELMEIVAVEMNVRFRRPDCDSDFLFVYDHRQFDTIMEMFTGLLEQFIEQPKKRKIKKTKGPKKK